MFIPVDARTKAYQIVVGELFWPHVLDLCKLCVHRIRHRLRDLLGVHVMVGFVDDKGLQNLTLCCGLIIVTLFMYES